MLKARDSCPTIVQHTGLSDENESNSNTDELRDGLGPLENHFNFYGRSRSQSNTSHRIAYNPPRFLRRSMGSLPNISVERCMVVISFQFSASTQLIF